MSRDVVTRTIGRRTEKTEKKVDPALAGQDANQDEEEEDSSSDDGGDCEASEATCSSDLHLMTKKELRRTFKEHTLDERATVMAYAWHLHVT